MYKNTPNRRNIRFLLPSAAAALLASTAMADYSSTVLSYNPLGYWRLNETTAPTADIATNIGTLGTAGNGYYTSGAIHPATGAIIADAADSGAGFPDAAGNRVVVPWNAKLATSGAFSVEFWAQSYDVTSSDSATMCPVAFTQFGEPTGASDGTRKGWLFYQNGSAGWTFRTYGNGNTGYSATATNGATTLQWYHVVGVYDGTNTILYVNGTKAASVAAASFAPVGENRAPFSVGARGYGSLGFFRYNGSVDEVAYYTNALTDADISAHYQNGISSAPSTPYEQVVQTKTPLIFLRFQEPAFTEPDVTAQPVAKNLGTLGSEADGNYLSGSTPGTAGVQLTGIATPRIGATFGPERSGSWVNAGTSSSLNFTGPFSIITWFKTAPIDSRFESFIGKGDSSWRAGVDTDGFPRFAFGTNPDVIGSKSVNDTAWHQLVGVFDGTTLSLYIDGILNGTASGTTAVTGNNNPVLIGSVGDYLDGRVFKGSMDEVAVYDTALTYNQVTNIYVAANVAPVILSIPSTATAEEGNALNIALSELGTPPLTHAWYKDGSLVSGATSAKLTIASTLAADSGSYVAVVSNAYGATTSAIVTVTIQSGPPVYTTTPTLTKYELYAGETFTITSVASGSVPITYQWYLNGTAVSGQTSSTLKLTNLKTTQSGDYAVVASNSYGTISNVIASLTVLPAPTATYPVAVLADSPIAYYRLNETNGTVGYDSVGGINGVYTGTVGFGNKGFAPTDSDTAVKFGPNVPSYLNLGTNINFASAANRSFSIEAWVKGPAQVGDVGLITKGTGSGGEQFNLDTGSSGAFRFFVRDASGNAKLANSDIVPDGAWHHLVGVVDVAAAKVILYVDGAYASDSDLGTGILASTHDVTIGARQKASGVYDFVFDGVMDDVAFYDKALSWSQVTAHYEARFTSTQAPVIVSQPVSVTNYASLPVVFYVDANGPELNFQWQHNGTDISGATFRYYTNSAITTADAGTYRVLISNGNGNVTSSNATLTVASTPASLNITSGLVLHLPFDSDYKDTSGEGIDGTAVGAPNFVTGKIGSGALHLTSDKSTTTYNYVTLGTPADLSFSSNVDFTVSLWVNLPAGSAPEDVPFIGNMVGSRYSAGYVFCPGYTNGDWSLGLNSDTVYTGGAINDGNWHHLTYVQARSSFGYVYLDGALALTYLLSSAGDLDTGKTVTIGQDPTGTYAATSEFTLDDIGVWRRALTPFEVASIYTAGVNGVTFAPKVVPVTLTISTSGTQVKITWTGGTLESADTINGTFTAVSGATSPYLVTPTTAAKFYRVKAN
jgi:hypothetical protein